MLVSCMREQNRHFNRSTATIHANVHLPARSQSVTELSTARSTLHLAVGRRQVHHSYANWTVLGGFHTWSMLEVMFRKEAVAAVKAGATGLDFKGNELSPPLPPHR